MKASNSDKKLLRIAVVAIILLLAALIWLAVNRSVVSGELEETKVSLDETTKFKDELEEEYSTAIAELEAMKSDNVDLNNRIEAQKMELTKQKDEISTLIRSKGELDQARRQLRELKANMDSYVSEINQLKAQNDSLQITSTGLKDTLQVVRENTKLMEEKLTSENLTLAEEREKLSSKVSMASVIKTTNISVKGIMVKKSGKEVSKSKAKSIDMLEICFTAMDNNIVNPGKEQFFIRIISPAGETISSASEGGGVTIANMSNKEIRYTVAKSTDYRNDSLDTCANYESEDGFASGTYNIEVYNKGYLSGKTTFELK